MTRTRNYNTAPPWSVGELLGALADERAVLDENGSVIGVTWEQQRDHDTPGDESPERDANAHFFAASPELVEAGTAFVTWFAKVRGTTLPAPLLETLLPIQTAMRAAIMKAYGADDVIGAGTVPDVVPAFLDARDLAAVLAGLRLLQNKVDPRTYGEDVDEILTDGGRLEPLDLDAIDQLCERLNGGEL